ncbi:MAG: CDGSH iron-sulfur domain-containing protein [Polyangiaceae bacterium]|nr:CDGSH iron-sulfur domain-containing protein [Polyangiaceae bacterium]
MKITARTNGPLIVEGSCDLRDQNGRSYTLPGTETFALCRCGGSAKTPFCDGTHVRNGFVSPSLEVPPRPDAVPQEAPPGDWETDGGAIDPSPPILDGKDHHARAHVYVHRLLR